VHQWLQVLLKVFTVLSNMRSNAFAVFLSFSLGICTTFNKACLLNISILFCRKSEKKTKVIMIAKKLVSDWLL